MSRLERPARLRSCSWIATAAIGVALLAWHASTYLPFLSDDALISLRYAERFVEGKGLSWTDGERVEGYSNLLWILGAAALKVLGLDLIVASRLLGLVGMAAAIVALAWAHRPVSAGGASELASNDLAASGPGWSEPDATPPVGWSALLPLIVGVFALALSGPMAVWVIGGLEQPMIAGLLAWAIVVVFPLVEPGDSRKTLAASIPLALLCLTRPDGALFTATFALAIVLARGGSLAAIVLALRLSALPAVVYLGQVAFRLFYYGDWVANTARVKVAFTFTRLVGGASYVGWGYLWLSGLSLLGSGAFLAVRDARRRRRILLLGVPLIVWSAYVSVVGGDIFPGRRHLVPVAVLLAFLAAEGLGWAAGRSRRWNVAGWAAGIAGLGLLLGTQLLDPENERARNERWEWAGEPIGRTLHAAFGERQPLMALDPAGCLPYWSKLPSLDMLGLNDGWLARNPPEDVGHGHLAHEFGDGHYVVSRRPDLVLFCSPWGSERACFRGGRELLAHPGFRADYQLVTFEGKRPFIVHSKIFVRKESEKIGVRRSEGAVEVPGYLLANTEGSLAVYIDEEKRLAGRLLDSTPGKIRIGLPPGGWRLTLDAYGSDPTIEVRAGKVLLAKGPAPLDFISTTAAVELKLLSPKKTIVRDLRLHALQQLAEGAAAAP